MPVSSEECEFSSSKRSIFVVMLLQRKDTFPGDATDSTSYSEQRLEKYRHGFKEAVVKKYGRYELLPSSNSLPVLFGLGERFIRKASSSEEVNGSMAAICEENLRKTAFEGTQFENECESFGFFDHMLSLPESDQADVFKTAITLDAVGALMKMQTLCSSACIMSMQGYRMPSKASSADETSLSGSQYKATKATFSSGISSSNSPSFSSSSSSSAVAINPAVSNLRGRLFDGSEEKKELSEKAADLVFQNPVFFFVKNAAASVTDALCSTKYWLPDLSYTEKVLIPSPFFIFVFFI